MSDDKNDYYVVVRSKGSDSYSLEQALAACPESYELHSVVPVADSQHGTSGFMVIFALRDFANGVG